MNDKRTVNKILRLLRAGFSQRIVADKCHVSKTLVALYGRGLVPAKLKDEALLPLAYHAGICPKHGKRKLPCVECLAEKYVHQHPELPWCNPMPIADDRMRRQSAIAMRDFNETDEFLNPDQP